MIHSEHYISGVHSIWRNRSYGFRSELWRQAFLMGEDGGVGIVWDLFTVWIGENVVVSGLEKETWICI